MVRATPSVNNNVPAGITSADSGPAGTTVPPGGDGSAWAENADALVAAVKRLYVNRFDRHGVYRGRRVGDAAPTISPLTYPAGGPKAGCLSDHILADHFTAAGQFRGITQWTIEAGVVRTGISATVGVHAISPHNTARFSRVDLDAHGPAATPQTAQKNLDAALVWYHRLLSLGITALLWDSDGRGGLWLDVVYGEPVSSGLAYDVGKWLTRDWRERGLDAQPETFPKQPELNAFVQWGSWARLPGFHPKRGCWSRLWDHAAGRWLAGRDAVDAFLRITGNDPRLLPNDVWASPDRIAQASTPAGTSVVVSAPGVSTRGRRTWSPDTRSQAGPRGGQDYQHKLYRARRLAESVGPKAEGGRNEAAYKIAAFCLGTVGLDPADTLLVLEGWNCGNAPPLDRGELETVTNNAVRYNRGYADSRRKCEGESSVWEAGGAGGATGEVDLSDVCGGEPYTGDTPGFAGCAGPAARSAPTCGKPDCGTSCGCPQAGVSELFSSAPEALREQVGHDDSQANEPPDPRSALIHKLVGNPPFLPACPRRKSKLWQGRTRETAELGALVFVSCSCWGCHVCRQRLRWQMLRDNVPLAFNATHTWRGSAAGLDALCKRLDRAGVKYACFWVRLSADERGAVFRVAGESIPAIPPDCGLEPITGEAAAKKMAHLINLIPADLPTGARRHGTRGPLGWAPQTESEDELIDAEVGSGGGEGGGGGEIDPTGQAEEDDHPWEDTGEVPVVRDPNEFAKLLFEIDAEQQARGVPDDERVNPTRGGMADWQEGGAIEDSLTWRWPDDSDLCRRIYSKLLDGPPTPQGPSGTEEQPPECEIPD